MQDKIKIDIVSDVVCPWCIIGYKRLQKAINDLEVEDKIQINWQAFELNPNISSDGENILEHMSRKYSMSKEQAKAYQEERKVNCNELGFDYNCYDEMKIVNTRDAHILLEYAREFGKQNELQMRFFKAHFSEKKIISDRDVLAKEVETIGLDSKDAMKILDGIKRDEIIKKEEYYRAKGVSAVPTMIFNDTSIMNGAYPVETYKQVIQELLENNK